MQQMQLQMQVLAQSLMGSGFDTRRFRFDGHPSPSQVDILPDGSKLTFTGGHCNGHRQATQTPQILPLPGAASSARSDLGEALHPTDDKAPAVIPPLDNDATAPKKVRLSVDAVADAIISGSSVVKDASKKSPLRSSQSCLPVPAHARRFKKPFQCYYNALPCKRFDYKTKAEEAKAKENTTEWLEVKCEAKGWTPVGIA